MEARTAVAALILACAALIASPSSAMPPPADPLLASFGSVVSDEIHDLAFDAAGNLYVSGHIGNAGRIFKITPTGLTSEFLGFSSLDDARGIAFDQAGGLYIADAGYDPARSTGRVLRVASGGTLAVVASGLRWPTSCALGPDGNLYVAEPLTGSIERVTPAGAVSAYAGGFSGPGESLGALAFGEDGALYAGVGGRIVRVGSGGTPVTTIVTGLDEVMGLLPYGAVFFVATYGHHDLRFVSASGSVSRLTNPALADPCVDGPIPAGASVSLPAGMRLHDGRVYVVDQGCHRIRVFDVALPVSAIPTTWGALKAHYR